MKKVLIFWLWFQWKKHINHFYDRWYLIDWVSKSWFNYDIKWLNFIYSFNDILKKEKFFFKKYDLIVVVAKPYYQQDNIINFLLSLKLDNKVIIEKPVTYNLKLLRKLLSRKNYYFFIDEIFFWKKFSNNSIADIKIILNNNDSSLFEHAMWFFLLRNDFKNRIQKIDINFLNSKYGDEFIFYNIIIWKYNIFCIGWIYYIWDLKITNSIFKNALSTVLNLNNEENFLFKNNYILLMKYIKSVNIFLYD